MIDIVFVRAIIINTTILLHIIIHHFLDIIKPFYIASIVPDRFNTFQDDSLVIAPACFTTRDDGK
jgi:hypothetical protein